MRDDLDKLLCERYPKIFSKRYAPMSETCMCWGFECGDGWFNIIDQLCARIQWRIDYSEEEHARNTRWLEVREAALQGDWEPFDELNGHYQAKNLDFYEKLKVDILGEPPAWRTRRPVIPQVVASQVKEKFGTLRFYYEGGDDYIRGLTTMAEAMSEVTCETCGAPGVLRKGSWLQTLCDDHADGRDLMQWADLNPFDANES